MITRNNTNSRSFNTVFDELLNAFPATWGKDINQATGNNIPVNIFENDEAFHLEVNAPGRVKENFALNIEQDLLTISYENKNEAEKTELKTIRKEFGVKNFKRSFSLDEKINADGIQAKYEDGVLKIFLPKKEEVKVTPKHISVQ